VSTAIKVGCKHKGENQSGDVTWAVVCNVWSHDQSLQTTDHMMYGTPNFQSLPGLQDSHMSHVTCGGQQVVTGSEMCSIPPYLLTACYISFATLQNFDCYPSPVASLRKWKSSKSHVLYIIRIAFLTSIQRYISHPDHITLSLTILIPPLKLVTSIFPPSLHWGPWNLASLADFSPSI
jgi:hypothetical protein